jgi:glyoxylase-like metal-dependent hydrolase (beta-lactamase superfamily II)
MIFRQLFDRETCTYTYLLADPDRRKAVLVDPVRELVDRDLALVAELDLDLEVVLETHVHADHVTGAWEIRSRVGARRGISRASGAEADLLLDPGDAVAFGRHRLDVRATPGHTAGCVTYVTAEKDRAFTGDALLIRGCGRTDFQEGDAPTLYRSIHREVFTLPDDCALYPAHDYQGRTVTTVAEEKRFNPRLGGDRTEAEFVAIMAGLHLAKPARIDVAVPANLAAPG